MSSKEEKEEDFVARCIAERDAAFAEARLQFNNAVTFELERDAARFEVLALERQLQSILQRHTCDSCWSYDGVRCTKVDARKRTTQHPGSGACLNYIASPEP